MSDDHNHDHHAVLEARVKTLSKVAELLQITNQIQKLALLKFVEEGGTVTVQLNPDLLGQRVLSGTGSGEPVREVTLIRMGDQFDIREGA